MRKYLKTYHLPALFILMLVVASMASGCAGTTHINNVAPENQEIESFILRTGKSLEKTEIARDAALIAAADLNKAGELSDESFNTIISISEKYDVAFKTAQSALLNLRQAVDRGESVSTASVEAAIAATRTALTELQIQEGL